MDSCCGHDICKDFDTFYCQVKKLLPPFYDDLICKGGVYESIVQAKAQAFYTDIYKDKLCKFLCESNPMTACETIACHAKELGLPDECYDACGIDPSLYPDEYQISLQAQVKAKVLLRYYKTPNAEMFKRLGELFYLNIDIATPHIANFEEISDCGVIWGDFDLEGDDSNVDCNGDTQLMARDFSCNSVESKIIIRILSAPKDLEDSSPSCNTFVETFKCMTAKYIPINVKYCFSDEYKNNPVVTIPLSELDCEC